MTLGFARNSYIDTYKLYIYNDHLRGVDTLINAKAKSHTSNTMSHSARPNAKNK